MVNEFNYSPTKYSLSSLIKLIASQLINWCADQIMLWESLLVALSFHVLLFPILWLMGWLLPWPKTPDVTTVIEINLENWPEWHSEKVTDIYFSKVFKKEKK